MADENESVEVTLDLPLEGGSATEEKAEIKTEAKAEDPIAVLQRQYDELRAKDESRARELETARQNELKAREEAQRSAVEVDRARTQIVSSELQANINAIAMEQATLDAAKREYIAAQEAGNFSGAADAQERISAATANRVALEREKHYLETRAPVTEGRVESRQQQQLPSDPVERAIVVSAMQGAPFSQRSADWLRAHPEVVKNNISARKAALADAEAREKGIPVDTDDYFAFVEDYLGYSQHQQQTTQPTTRPRSMPAAPPSREPAATNGGSKKVDVSLSAAERRSATDGTLVWNTGPNKGKPIGVEEMAKRKHFMADKYKSITATSVN